MDRDFVSEELEELRRVLRAREKELEACRRQVRELKKFEIIADQASYGVVIRGLDGNFVYVNPAYAELHGMRADELVGKPVDTCHTPEQMNHVNKLGKIREQTGSFVSEVEHKRLDGSLFPTMMTGTNIRDDEGNLLYYTSTTVDISDLKRAETELRKREKELEIKNMNLEEMNTALRVIIRKSDENKHELEEKIFSNMKELVVPYLHKLKNSPLDNHQTAYLEVLESNLQEVLSPFSRNMTAKFQNLTPAEIQVANLIRNGKSTKDMAQLMGVSPRTVEFHRDNLRLKMGIKGKRINLRSYLLTLQ